MIIELILAECLHHFGVAPRKTDCRGSFIKLTWIKGLKDCIVLTDDIQIQRYVKCHIMLLFGDKSGAAFSWGSACLAHLNRSLCRATCVDCKEMDGPLTLFLTWVWICLLFLASISDNPQVFPIANRWRNWERGNYAYRYHTLAHYRRLLDDLQEGHAYSIDHIKPDMISVDIRQHSVVWSATVPLISFDRFRRQVGLIQDIPNQEQDLDASHGKYQGTFGAHLQISDLVFQENSEGPHNQEDQQQEPPTLPLPPPPVQQKVQYVTPYVLHTHPSDYFTQSVLLHQQYWSGPQVDVGEQASFSKLLGFMAPGPGYLHSDSIPQVRTTSENSGDRMFVDWSRSVDATRGIIQSGNTRRIPMSLIQESNKSVDDETDDYLVDHPDSDGDEDEDENEDEDEEDDNDVDDEPAGQDDEDHGDDPTPSTATSEKGKGYNLRTDPPRRSTNRYTPSAFNRVVKKCKKLYKDHRMSSVPTHTPYSLHLYGWYNPSSP
ncbi:hypothetical protein Ahy_B03g066125 [Arachis hypogaea]|uniref:Aminotransferase-like plant mobile domain-containing protein n=1 Tax=Arachis hypogaea TaxID=3818 RepID=A0A445A376_ARAHY|nr:hypothetical protein Ahy_B03g066125 [Arachis hypogaea]